MVPGGDTLKKLTFAMLIMTFLLFLGLGIYPNQSLANTTYDSEANRDVYLNIMTCNKMQYEMVKAIVGDKHNVEFMFIDEQDSLNFKYNQETTNNLENMDLFLYSGNGYEPWVSKLNEDISNGKVGIIDLSRGLRTIDFNSNENSKINPYYWTGLDEYKIALYNIKAAIQDKDPINREFYEENYNDAINKVSIYVRTTSDQKVKLNEYTFIALDEYLDYFYKNLSITPLKLDGKTIKEIIEEKKLDPTKVVILKDKDTKFEEKEFKVINLEKYNGNSSVEELIINNYRSLYKGIES